MWQTASGDSVANRRSTRWNKKSDGSIWRGRKEAEGKRVAPARDPAPRFAKSELCRRDCELMDVSRMDIFCSVAIYGWRGLERGRRRRGREEGGGREGGGEGEVQGGSDRHNLH